MLQSSELKLVNPEASEPSWQKELSDAIRSTEELDSLHWAFLRAPDFRSHPALNGKYRVLVPRAYLALIDPHDPADPIARMAFPGAAELDESGKMDPIGDLERKAAPRLTHRYTDRVLLHTTNLCPMYCRFCFRKNLMNEADENLYGGGFDEAFAYIRSQPQLREVILTGGDPWMLSDAKLGALLHQILAIPSIERIRFHTRMPVTLPTRVTKGLLALLESLVAAGKRVYVVTHFNHPKEITAASRLACKEITSRGVRLLNQAVLLKGVNNSSSTLRELFLGLEKMGVLPYYLHHGDTVAGAGHFRTSVEESLAIYRELRGTLSGYALPELVVDLPGGFGKVPLAELEKVGPGKYRHGKSPEAYFD
jgi:lysine 2,3-aminomutase